MKWKGAPSVWRDVRRPTFRELPIRPSTGFLQQGLPAFAWQSVCRHSAASAQGRFNVRVERGCHRKAPEVDLLNEMT